MMTERCTFGRILLSSVALVAAVACQQAVRSALLAEGQPTVCYHLAFAPWTSTSQAPFAKAAVGLVNPLPDTIALTGSVTTPYGRSCQEGGSLTLPQPWRTGLGRWRSTEQTQGDSKRLAGPRQGARSEPPADKLQRQPTPPSSAEYVRRYSVRSSSKLTGA